MSESFTGIEVELVGNDGNAFAILGTVTKAMRRGRVAQDIIEKSLGAEPGSFGFMNPKSVERK